MRRMPWGWKLLLEQSEEHQLWLCRGEQGYTSQHFHPHLSNAIYVLSGCLDLVMFNSLEGEEEIRRMYPGDGSVVLPRENHRLLIVDPGYFAETFHCENQDPIGEWEPTVLLDPGSSESWMP